MAWDDDLLPASFRGVAFFIEGVSLKGGRSVVNHVFPQRDEPFSEDTGRKQKIYPITGHIIGDDLFEQRKRLENVFDKEGPGQLIHPYYGPLRVQIEEYEFSDDTNVGRRTNFSLTFFEAGSFKFPSVTQDKQATLLNSSANALEATKGDFASKFSIAKQPGFLVDSARSKLASATKSIGDATNTVTVISNAAAELSFSLRQIENDLDTLMNTPALLAERLSDALALLTGVAEDKAGAVSAYRTLGDFGNDTPIFPSGTPTRTQQQLNDDTTNNFIQTLALIRQSEDVSDVEFDSLQDALDERERILSLFGEKIEDENISDELYQSLTEMQANLVDILPDVTSELPDEITITPLETTSSLLLAYDVFQDPEKEQDIIDRNKIEHPGFIPGGQPLEIISQ